MKSATLPRISVVIPYYEGARWLPASAASVLAQKDAPLELIVVDDGSSEPVGKVLRLPADPRLRFIRIDHLGKGAAVNRAIAEARGDLICVLDQDDTMAEGRLSRQLRVLDADPAAAAVYSDYERVTEKGELIDAFISRQASNREMLHAMAADTGLISMQTMLVRKSAVVRLGGFSEEYTLTGMDDGDFFVKLMASGYKLAYCPGVSARWTSHCGNYSKQAQFQETRLVFLRRLSELSIKYPMLLGEMRYFRHHAFYMRGIYFMEHGSPRRAIGEFLRALAERPFHINTCYLCFKSLAMGLFERPF